MPIAACHSSGEAKDQIEGTLSQPLRPGRRGGAHRRLLPPRQKLLCRLQDVPAPESAGNPPGRQVRRQQSTPVHPPRALSTLCVTRGSSKDPGHGLTGIHGRTSMMSPDCHLLQPDCAAFSIAQVLITSTSPVQHHSISQSSLAATGNQLRNFFVLHNGTLPLQRPSAQPSRAKWEHPTWMQRLSSEVFPLGSSGPAWLLPGLPLLLFQPWWS